MEKIGVPHFALAGLSGGAPYAAAVAARLGNRIAKLALVSPVGPFVEYGISLGLRHRLQFTALSRRPATVSAAVRAFDWSLASITRLTERLVTWSAPRVDKRAVQNPSITQAILRAVRDGSQSGAAGPKIDLAIFSQPWAVDLSAIAAPSRVWIGTADSIVPIAAARALARRIPNCVLTELPGEGHLWASQHYAEVLEWFLEAPAPATLGKPFIAELTSRSPAD